MKRKPELDLTIEELKLIRQILWKAKAPARVQLVIANAILGNEKVQVKVEDDSNTKGF